MDFLKFYTGKCMDAYEFLGCHLVDGGAVFRTFAPAARAISVIGDFNGWKETPMNKIHDGQFWECFIPNVREGMFYKYDNVVLGYDQSAHPSKKYSLILQAITENQFSKNVTLISKDSNDKSF